MDIRQFCPLVDIRHCLVTFGGVISCPLVDIMLNIILILLCSLKKFYLRGSLPPSVKTTTTEWCIRDACHLAMEDAGNSFCSIVHLAIIWEIHYGFNISVVYRRCVKVILLFINILETYILVLFYKSLYFPKYRDVPSMYGEFVLQTC